eukprot:1144853-Pelagomonas_calceolata.AAC.13
MSEALSQSNLRAPRAFDVQFAHQGMVVAEIFCLFPVDCIQARASGMLCPAKPISSAPGTAGGWGCVPRAPRQQQPRQPGGETSRQLPVYSSGNNTGFGINTMWQTHAQQQPQQPGGGIWWQLLCAHGSSCSSKD